MEPSFFKKLMGFQLRTFVFIIFSTSRLSECGTDMRQIMDDNPMTQVVVAGTVAILPCSVDPKYTEQHGEQFSVMWVSPRETPISMQDRRIINDQRMSIERKRLEDWNLFIRNVSLTDKGTYKCQINTDPVRTKNVTLKINAPPSIIDHSLPLAVEKPEGDKVELFCNATGQPMPNISWYRLNRHGNGKQERVGNVGESLVIHNITRVCADMYRCVADNGVLDPRSQDFTVTVLYPPEVTLPNSRLGQSKGKETILDCDVFASPQGVAVWKKNGRILTSVPGIEINIYNINSFDGITLNLRLQHISEKDYGIYECEAVNALGTVSDTMELYQTRSRHASTTTTTTPSTTTIRRKNWPKNKHNKDIIDINGGSKAWDGNSNKWDTYYSNKEQFRGEDKPHTPGRSSQRGVDPQTVGGTSGNGDGSAAASRLAQLHSHSLMLLSVVPALLSGFIAFIMR